MITNLWRKQMTARVPPSLIDYLMNHNDLVLDLVCKIYDLEDQLEDVLEYLKPKYTVKKKGNPTHHLINDEWLLANNIMKTLNKEYIGPEAAEHMRKFSLSIIEVEDEEANADGV